MNYHLSQKTFISTQPVRPNTNIQGHPPIGVGALKWATLCIQAEGSQSEHFL